MFMKSVPVVVVCRHSVHFHSCVILHRVYEYTKVYLSILLLKGMQERGKFQGLLDGDTSQ